MAFFVLVGCFDPDMRPARTNPNPIALTASAANASVQFKRPYRNCPDHVICARPHTSVVGAVPIGIYRFSVPIRNWLEHCSVAEQVVRGESAPLQNHKMRQVNYSRNYRALIAMHSIVST